MRTPVCAVLLAASLLAGCSGDGGQPEACNPMQDTSRCKGNEYQTCLSGGCAFGPCSGPTWATLAICTSPQVCKVGTNRELLQAYQSGCFDPGSTCDTAGFVTCDVTFAPPIPVHLWTCSRMPSDRSLQWTLTRCDQELPAKICLPHSNWLGQGAPPTGCYETAGTCGPSSWQHGRCEGNVLYHRTGPTMVNGKAAFDWVVNMDCAAQGLVCRVDQYGNGSCASP